MKSLLLLAAWLLPSIGFSATVSVSVVNSSAPVDLASVGTLDWARWWGYSNKAGLISNVKIIGTLRPYTDDRRIIGTRSGIEVSGGGAEFEFDVPVSTTERTLVYYIGGWNSTGRVTVMLPGAPTYSVDVEHSASYSRVVTIKYKGNPADRMEVRYTHVAGAGRINMQAVALAESSSVFAALAPVSGSAVLNWTTPTHNTDGSPLEDLTGFTVYWFNALETRLHQFRIYNLAATSHTVTGLAPGRWYFSITATTASGQESAYSSAVSKLIE